MIFISTPVPPQEGGIENVSRLAQYKTCGRRKCKMKKEEKITSCA
jgi:hypothetical protein